MVRRLVVEGGTLVTGGGRTRRDLLVEGETVAAIGQPGSFRHIEGPRIDASGQYILPGVIDAHVHSRDPGATHKEDIGTLTLGALKGGVTTVLEMPNTVPPVHDPASFRAKAESYAGRAYTDFGLWGLILGDRNRDQLAPLAAEGVVGFKLFWGYALDPTSYALVYNPGPGQDALPPPDEGEVLDSFAVVAGLGRPFAIHAESKAILDRHAARTGPAPGDTYAAFLAGRPAFAEAHLIRVAASLAGEVGGHLHIVHLSSGAGLQAVREARLSGVRISVETCPHYLTLSAEEYERVGPSMKCYPPIREAVEQKALWAGVEQGEIDTIGSDHAPHTAEEKKGSLREIPAGFPGVELLLPLLLDHVAAGRLTLERVVELTAENPARLFGLDDRKGFLEPGKDADFCLVDPDRVWSVEARRLASKSKVSPYEGREIRGCVTMTVLRGEVVMEEGEVKGAPSGQLLRVRRVSGTKESAKEGIV